MCTTASVCTITPVFHHLKCPLFWHEKYQISCFLFPLNHVGTKVCHKDLPAVTWKWMAVFYFFISSFLLMSVGNVTLRHKHARFPWYLRIIKPWKFFVYDEVFIIALQITSNYVITKCVTHLLQTVAHYKLCFYYSIKLKYIYILNCCYICDLTEHSYFIFFQTANFVRPLFVLFFLCCMSLCVTVRSSQSVHMYVR